MSLDGVLFVDGSSDKGLSRPLEMLCRKAGLSVNIVVVDPQFTPASLRKVENRIAWASSQLRPDLVFIHRDAEKETYADRSAEISRAVATRNVTYPVVPVIPVRMTEAWLLLDEGAIRRVAGRPDDRNPLGLPTVREVERLADPKKRLEAALIAASGLKGRKLSNFTRDLASHRERLLERLDLTGRVAELSSLKLLESEIRLAATKLLVDP